MERALGSKRTTKRITYRLGQQVLAKVFHLPIYLIWSLHDAKKVLGKSFNVIGIEAFTAYLQAHHIKIVSLDEVDSGGRGVPTRYRPETIAHLYPPGEPIPEQPINKKGEWRYREEMS